MTPWQREEFFEQLIIDLNARTTTMTSKEKKTRKHTHTPSCVSSCGDDGNPCWASHGLCWPWSPCCPHQRRQPFGKVSVPCLQSFPHWFLFTLTRRWHKLHQLSHLPLSLSLSQLLTAGLASSSSSHPLPVHRRVPCPPSTSLEDTMMEECELFLPLFLSLVPSPSFAHSSLTHKTGESPFNPSE